MWHKSEHWNSTVNSVLLFCKANKDLRSVQIQKHAVILAILSMEEELAQQ
jgi:hypothetical protein